MRQTSSLSEQSTSTGLTHTDMDSDFSEDSVIVADSNILESAAAFETDSLLAIDNDNDSIHLDINDQPESVIVRIWEKQTGDKKGYHGHIAVEIPSQNIYMSYIPASRESNVVTLAHSYDEDRAGLSGRQCDDEITLYTLNVKIMAIAYYQLFKRLELNAKYKGTSFLALFDIADDFMGHDQIRSSSYELLGEGNCSKTAKLLLDFGGLNKLYKPSLQMPEIFLRFNMLFILAVFFAFLGGGFKNTSQKTKNTIFFMFLISCFLNAIAVLASCARCIRGRTGGFVTPKGLFETVKIAKKKERMMADSEIKRILEINKQQYLNEIANLRQKVSDNKIKFEHLHPVIKSLIFPNIAFSDKTDDDLMSENRKNIKRQHIAYCYKRDGNNNLDKSLDNYTKKHNVDVELERISEYLDATGNEQIRALLIKIRDCGNVLNLKNDPLVNASVFNNLTGEVINAALSNNHNITTIWLDENIFNRKIAGCMKTIISINNSITSISLNNCDLFKETVSPFLQSFSKNTSIQFVSLRNNKLGGTSASHLIKALKYNKAIKTVDLSQNKIGGVMFVTCMRKYFSQNDTVTHLLLSHNEIGNSDINSLSKIFSNDKFHRRSGVRMLDVRENSFDHNIVTCFSYMLKTNSLIVELKFSKERIDTNTLTEIEMLLKENQTLQSEYLSNPEKFSTFGEADRISTKNEKYSSLWRASPSPFWGGSTEKLDTEDEGKNKTTELGLATHHTKN